VSSEPGAGQVLHFYGIELRTDPFLTLFYLAFASSKLILEALILFIVLRVMGEKVTQGVVFVCYSIAVTYAPLFGWIDIPTTVHTVDILELLRSQHLNLTDTAVYYFQHAKELNDKLGQPLPIVRPYLGVLTNGLYIISTMLVAECLAQVSNIAKPRAYIATALATILNIVPQMLVAQFWITLTFEFLTGSAVQNSLPH
jgi:hypothetical protein